MQCHWKKILIIVKVNLGQFQFAPAEIHPKRCQRVIERTVIKDQRFVNVLKRYPGRRINGLEHAILEVDDCYEDAPEDDGEIFEAKQFSFKPRGNIYADDDCDSYTKSWIVDFVWKRSIRRH